jgi:formylmethanofuran dehydrogenase subunit A
MSQNTLVIVDGTGLEVLGYINDALNTLVTTNSGSAAPATTYAYMLWADTTANQLKMRNAANTDWIVLGALSANFGLQPSGNYITFTATTGAASLPSGTTGQRPASPAAGQFRFNSTANQFEGYNGTSWGSVGGASGTNGNSVFYENDQTVTANYTITSGKNAMSAGEITIANGITVTVPTGSSWVIV